MRGKFQLTSALLLAALSILNTRQLQAANSVTVSEGTNFSVDVSPLLNEDDQRLIIMDLQGMLWLLPEEGGKAMRLTGPEDDIRLPRFSPDGGQLLFQSFRDGAWQLALTSSDGTQRRNLTRGIADNRDPAWSPTGDRVLFSSDRSGNYEIWSLDLNTAELVQLSDDPADDHAPAVAPDGSVAYISERAGNPVVTLMPATVAGAEAAGREIYTAPAGKLAGLRFSADGQYLAFVQASERIAFPAISRNDLVILTVATGEYRVVTGNEDVFPLPPSWLDADTLLYSADGLIHKRSLDSDSHIVIPFAARLNIKAPDLDLDEPDTFKRKRQPVLGIVNPVATEGGKQIVFEALGDLWMRHEDGGLIQLTDDKYADRDPHISNDARWLAYISDRSGSMQVWMRDTVAGTDTRLTAKARGPRFPTFSKDGTKLAWQEVGPIGTGDFTLNVLDLLSGKNRRLKHAPPVWPGPMSWSADSEFITVAKLHSTSTRYRDGRNRLVRVAVNDDRTFVNDLPGDLVADFGPVSSADGAQTALIIDGALYIVATGPDGAFAGPLIRVLDELAESPSWSNNSSQLTYLSATGLARLNLGTNKTEELPVALRWRNVSPEGKTIVHAGRLYTGMSPNYRSNVDIEIERGRIVAVKRHRRHPDNARVIDAGNRTVLPGLIDHHGHFQPHQGEWVGRAWLAHGVTTVVEPGGMPWQSRTLMETWGNGKRAGPRLVFAGPQLDGYRRSFHFASHINSDRRLQWELERADALGYGLLKTYVRMPPERQRRAIELAGKLDLPVTAHSAFRNFAFGGSRVEHLGGTGRLGFSAKRSDAQIMYADVLGVIGANATAITPTVVVAGGFFRYLLSNPELLDNTQVKALYPEAYRKGLLGFAEMMGKNRSLLAYGHDNALQSIARLHEEGAQIVAGTDSPIFPYGLALLVELINYQEAGLASWEVLETATSGAAAAIGAEDEVGSIRAGRLADLVIVDGDPLDDISDLMNVTGVMRNGNYFSLDELLE
ncbi:MAG: amidohydrolase family protein [Gammaproteobacteria bacterium]|nr:amidohydrolase family protein [Gammaproteobacteria bacterium]